MDFPFNTNSNIVMLKASGNRSTASIGAHRIAPAIMSTTLNGARTRFAPPNVNEKGTVNARTVGLRCVVFAFVQMSVMLLLIVAVSLNLIP